MAFGHETENSAILRNVFTFSHTNFYIRINRGRFAKKDISRRHVPTIYFQCSKTVELYNRTGYFTEPEICHRGEREGHQRGPRTAYKKDFHGKKRPVLILHERVSSLKNEKVVPLSRTKQVSVTKMRDAKNLCCWGVAVQFLKKRESASMFEHHVTNYNLGYIGCSRVGSQSI